MSHKVTTIVPEHIQLEKPELMAFMEAYYEYMEQEAVQDQINSEIYNLSAIAEDGEEMGDSVDYM